MPVATVVIRTQSIEDTVNRIARPKRVVIRQVSGSKRSFSFPIGPLQVRYEGLGIDFVNIERPGDIALLEASAIKPRTIAMNAVIADRATGGLVSVESQLEVLRLMAVEDIDLTFTYGVRSLDYRVRITNLSFESMQRDLDGNITQANVSIQLTERPRRLVDPITLNAIRYTPPSSPSKSKKKTKSSSGSSKTKQPSIDLKDATPSKPLPGGSASRFL